MKTRAFFQTLVMAVSVLFAQHAIAQRGGLQTALSGGAQTAIPTGDFANQFDGTPVGLAATVSGPTFRGSPVHMGFGFAWNRMGSESESVFVNNGEALTSGNVELVTNRYNYSTFLRLAPFRGRIQPFAEGVAGWSNYVTRKDITGRYANGESMESTERMHNNMAWMYGWGAGVQFRVAPHIFLEGKFQRMYESRTTMIDHQRIMLQNNGTADFSTMEVRPEFAVVQVGLTIRF